MAGPLDGIRVLEFAGIGPAPFACMLLADLGAEAMRIARPGAALPPQDVTLARGRVVQELDLKDPAAIEACLHLAEAADILVEGMRPGVMERLGLGPDVLHARNPRLVYGRMTGWGQTGARASQAGHDINYLAVTGALAAIGPKGKPVPPLNLVADFGGGAMYLVAGVLAALLHVRAGGAGQVVDAAMVDGATHLMAMTYGLHGAGLWRGQRAANLIDGGAPFYDTYVCADGGWIAVGAIEPQFFGLFLEGLGIDPADYGPQHDVRAWDRQRALIAGAFVRYPRAHWAARFARTDACVTPVLSMADAIADPVATERGTFAEIGGIAQPRPAPRFSATVPATPAPARAGSDVGALVRWGVPPALAARLPGGGAGL